MLQQMSEGSGHAEATELARWAIPIQERHLEDVQGACLKLAAEEDPNELAE